MRKNSAVWTSIYNEVDVDKAIDIMFNHVDSLLRAGEFDVVDSFIEGAKLEEMSKALIVGLLSVTLAAKDKLSNRRSFYYYAKSFLQRYFSPAEISRLLEGLE